MVDTVWVTESTIVVVAVSNSVTVVKAETDSCAMIYVVKGRVDFERVSKGLFRQYATSASKLSTRALASSHYCSIKYL